LSDIMEQTDPFANAPRARITDALRDDSVTARILG